MMDRRGFIGLMAFLGACGWLGLRFFGWRGLETPLKEAMHYTRLDATGGNDRSGRTES